jgi:ubiquinone/menaquinone biosynthesis C-methylase UbiE
MEQSTMTHSVWGQSPGYDDLVRRRAFNEGPEMEAAIAACGNLANVYQRGDRILDVGCAGGHLLHSLRERVDPGVDYLGVDFTALYLEWARMKFGDMPWVRGDIGALPFPNASFDTVLCLNTIPHLPAPPTPYLRELMRVAKRDVIIRLFVSDRTYLIQEVHAPSLNGAQVAEEEADAIGPEGPRKGSFHHLYSGSYLQAVITELRPDSSVEIVPHTMPTNFDSRGEGARSHVLPNGWQISGNLLLESAFVMIHLPYSK